MQKIFRGMIILTLVAGLPVSTPAEIDINISIPVPHVRIGIPMPPLIHFAEPPRLVVVPETYVYVAPDIEEEIFYSDGWWWRPWEGRWYRSRHHDSGWQRYKNTPSFYRHIPNDWRSNYRDRHWQGRQWNVNPIPHQQVQKNWHSWKTNRHWEGNQSWGVQDLQRRRDSPRATHKERQQKDSKRHRTEDVPRHGK
jgi:hypothetical protein